MFPTSLGVRRQPHSLQRPHDEPVLLKRIWPFLVADSRWCKLWFARGSSPKLVIVLVEMLKKVAAGVAEYHGLHLDLADKIGDLTVVTAFTKGKKAAVQKTIDELHFLFGELVLDGPSVDPRIARYIIRERLAEPQLHGASPIDDVQNVLMAAPILEQLDFEGKREYPFPVVLQPSGPTEPDLHERVVFSQIKWRFIITEA